MATSSGKDLSTERLEEEVQRSRQERRDRLDRERHYSRNADSTNPLNEPAEDQKAELVRRRRTPRARATRVEKDYDAFSKRNPDPALFTTYNHAELDEMRLRAEDLKTELSFLDNKVSEVMNDPHFTQYDVETECDQSDKYTSKLNLVISCCKIVEAERETETQVRLNLSRAGMSPGAIHRRTPISGVRPEDSRASTPEQVPIRGGCSPVLVAPP